MDAGDKQVERFLTRLNINLVVHVRERIPLCKPVEENGDIGLSSQKTSWLRTMLTDPVITNVPVLACAQRTVSTM